jgi:hypothetical protein
MCFKIGKYYVFCYIDLSFVISYTIVLKPGPARDPGLESGRVEKKTGEKKTRCDPARPGCNPLTFFLLKRRRFDLKKLTRATR